MNETTAAVREISFPLPIAKHPTEWTPEQIFATLQKLKQMCSKAEVVHLDCDSNVPNSENPIIWPLCAAAIAIAPTCLQLRGRDVLGEHQLICTPFPIDAGGCDCGIEIEVHEVTKRALAIVTIDPVRFDYLRYDSIVAPPVTKGMQVILRGSLPLPVAVALALSYAPDAESVWVQERIRSGPDVCVFSRNPEYLGSFANEDFTVIRRGRNE